MGTLAEPLGAFTRKLDQNARLALPDVFLEDYPRKIILCPGYDREIRGYTPKEWEKFDRQLAELDKRDPDNADFVRFFRSMAHTVKLDGNDRFKLSEALMTWAGFDGNKREVVVFDSGEYLEIWESNTWNEYIAAKSAEIKALARRKFGTDGNHGDEQPAAGATAPAGDGD